MSISDHSNGLSSSIEFRCYKVKQDKRLSNHHFPLHIPQQIKHHSGDLRYEAHRGMRGRENQKRSWGWRIYLGSDLKNNIKKNWSIYRHGRTDGERYGDWGGSSEWNKRNTRTQKSVICWLVCSIRQVRNKNKVKLTVKYDMGWKKRSSGRRCDSSSGHALIIGGRSKEIIGMVLCSKACRKCDAAENRGEEAEEHEYPKNF